MSDRKKVILDNLEHCRKNQNSNDCQSCEYGGRSFQICERLVDDIIILLKEQEPVKPIKSKLSFTHGFNWDIWDCGCCGNQLRSFAKYCDQCGKAVKWE